MIESWRSHRTRWFDKLMDSTRDDAAGGEDVEDSEEEITDQSEGDEASPCDSGEWKARDPEDERRGLSSYYPQPAIVPGVYNDAAMKERKSDRGFKLTHDVKLKHVYDREEFEDTTSSLVWRHVKDLGSGGYGTASLWVLYNMKNGEIVDVSI